MQRAIPNGAERFVVSGFSPPLPYPDDHFDVIYAMSIFTHFTEADQMAWLRELARVLTPDGMAVLTTSGETAMDKTWWERVGPGVHDQLWPATGRLDEVGFAFASYADVASDPEKFPGVEGTYGLTFQSEEWTRERWGEVFDIVQYRPAGLLGFQDIVVVRQQGRAAIDAAEVDAAEVDAAA
jgi:ubiquinone/menaquinone biosynthesis C-methylase UbiE